MPCHIILAQVAFASMVPGNTGLWLFLSTEGTKKAGVGPHLGRGGKAVSPGDPKHTGHSARSI